MPDESHYYSHNIRSASFTSTLVCGLDKTVSWKRLLPIYFVRIEMTVMSKTPLYSDRWSWHGSYSTVIQRTTMTDNTLLVLIEGSKSRQIVMSDGVSSDTNINRRSITDLLVRCRIAICCECKNQSNVTTFKMSLMSRILCPNAEREKPSFKSYYSRTPTDTNPS